MTVRNLDHALAPRSVAVIGASTEEGSVGGTLTKNVLAGGFQGEVYLVNPHHDARISIEPSEVEMEGPNPRLAIRPYPNQWERWADIESGERIFIRPIRPTDEHLYGEFVAKLSLEDIRFRF